MKLLCHLLFFIIVILLVSGCDTINNNADQSFLTKLPCESPCWYGLELNKSTSQEILAVLKNLSFIKANSINDYEVSDSNGVTSRYINYNCVYQVDDSWCGTLIIENDKLISINYALGFDLNIKTVVNIYGFPDFVQYQTPITERGGCALFFYWLDNDMRIGFYDNKISKPCDKLDDNKRIDPEQRIKLIEFSTQDLLSQYLEGPIVISWPGYSENK